MMENPPFDPATGDWVPPPPAAATPTSQVMASPSPDPAGERNDRRTRIWNIVLAVDAALLVAFLLGGPSLARAVYGDPANWTAPVLRVILGANVALNLIFMGIVPLLWARATRIGGWDGAIRYFGLTSPARAVLRGIGWWAAAWGALIVLAVILERSGIHPDNPEVALINSVITWPLALALAAGAALGEELFFRGILQKRIGWVGQAIAFGLVHISYGTVLQVLFPLALGLFWGWLRRRGESLFALMTAHFLFDFVQLAIGILLREHPDWFA